MKYGKFKKKTIVEVEMENKMAEKTAETTEALVVSEESQIKEVVEGGIPNITSATDAQLRDAWRILSLALSKTVRDGLFFQANCQRLTEWQLVCGLLAHLHANGGLSSPILDPAWMSPNPIQQEKSVCEYCKTTFVPKWRNQRFCTNECGLTADAEERNARAKAVIDEKLMAYAEEIADA